MMGSHATILVVDDDPASVRLIQSHLRMMGFDRFRQAGDGGAALEAVAQGDVGLVISDVQMRPQNGLFLLSRLRADRLLSETPLILTSGEERYRDRALEAGADAFLLKPFSGQRLRDEVARLYHRTVGGG